MDGLQLAIKRAQFAKATPVVVHEPPRRVEIVERCCEAEVVTPPPEDKSVESEQSEIAALNGRFEGIERQLSRLMHMVGAYESTGVVGPKYVTAADIKRMVSEYYGLSDQELTGRIRHARVAHARQVAYYLCRRFTMLSLPKIGAIFDRDHTSVLSGAARITAHRVFDESLDADLTKLEALVAEILRRRQEAMQPT